MQPTSKHLRAYLLGAELPSDVREAIERSLDDPTSPESAMVARLTEVNRIAFSADDSESQPQSALVVTPPRRWFSGRWAAFGPAAAAVLLVGIGLGVWAVWLHTPGKELATEEILWVGLHVSPRRTLGAPLDIAMEGGVVHLPATSSFDLEYRSPRPGFATLVFLSADGVQVYPGAGEPPVPAHASDPSAPAQRYPGPLPTPWQPTTLLVLITPHPASEAIRKLLTSEVPAVGDEPQVLYHIRSALPPREQPWLAAGRLRIVPKERSP